jgi:Ser/Thr protein kinase RdoA (MazF antagonist)
MTWFLISKNEEGINTDWDLDDPSQIKEWVAGYYEFRDITGTTVNHYDPL